MSYAASFVRIAAISVVTATLATSSIGWSSDAKEPVVATSVRALASGGYWQDGENRGTYRIIVETEGWEHLTSSVYVEWLAEEAEAKAVRVAARRMVTELSSQETFSDPRITTRKGITRATLKSMDDEGVGRTVELELGSPGKYRLRTTTGYKRPWQKK